MTQYTSHFRGPRAGGEMHVVLVDNGRSERLGMEKFWPSLKCIRCGACMNTCPVFRRSGGLSYGATYAGPIGIILDPTFNAHKYSKRPFSSTLNGSCANVCPVKIKVHEQIADWRKVMSETHELPLMKKAMMQAAGVLLSSPALYRAALPAADSALRHLPRFIVYNRLNTFAAESMFEYGSRVGFWRVARLLSERGTAATIFGCAVALERHPEVAAAIRQLGYDICCHGYRWRRHQSLSMERERERIAAAIVSVERTCGERPRGWYCRYGPSVNTRPLLVEEGSFYYDLDAYNDELPYWTKVAGRDHLVIPYSLATNDVKFMRGGIATGREFFDFLREAFDFLYAEVASMPRMMLIGLHPRIVGHPTRASGLEAFIDCLAANRGVWICRRSDIASHWRTHHPSTDRALV